MATLKLTALSRGGLCLLNLSKTVNNSSIGITGILSNAWSNSSVRYYKHRNVYPHLLDLNKRRERIAEDQKLRNSKEERPRRSDFIEWNYSTELLAFEARLGEKFDEGKLRQAFISPEYVEAEMRRQEELEINTDNPDVEIQTNTKLATEGRKLISESLRGYLRTTLPYLPEEGVQAVCNKLCQDKLLARVSFHIGTMDLILVEEYPPPVATMRQTFEAIIGALASTSQTAASRLVLDLVATQLHGLDLTDLWDVNDPMAILTTVLANENRGQPEARLLWASGKETMLACYHVGIYSDQELIGQAPGETASIGEEMAAHDALRRLFRFDEAAKPLLFGRDLKEIKLKSTPNADVNEWKSENVVVV